VAGDLHGLEHCHRRGYAAGCLDVICVASGRSIADCTCVGVIQAQHDRGCTSRDVDQDQPDIPDLCYSEVLPNTILIIITQNWSCRQLFG
jgi:hypothetical protein